VKISLKARASGKVCKRKSNDNSNNNNNNDELQTVSIRKHSNIELPTIAQLLVEEYGLMGVLRADVHQVFNYHFGTNASIAAKILLCLGKG
jgi:hypothetical protein